MRRLTLAGARRKAGNQSGDGTIPTPAARKKTRNMLQRPTIAAGDNGLPCSATLRTWLCHSPTRIRHTAATHWAAVSRVQRSGEAASG